MLFEYGLTNFFSFKEGALVSFRFDKNTPAAVSRGQRCASVLGVHGANASGKTQLLKALQFLSWFCSRSFAIKPDADMPISAFATSEQPSGFYVEFECNDASYRYECEVLRARVCREVLYRTKSRRTKLFERIDNALEHVTREYHALQAINYRSNVSVIATVNQHQLGILDDVYEFFRNIYSNVSFRGLYDLHLDINETARFLHDTPACLERVNALIGECDTGVRRVLIEQRESEDGQCIYYPTFMHDIDGIEFPVPASMESSGTKRLFQVFPLYLSTLENGGVLVADEFDLHLHPHLLPAILDCFLDPVKNPKHAQLLLTSHDSNIMDTLGRYRTYVTTKRDNESFAFRLDDVPGDLLRNDRPIAPIYEASKIGGVPRV